MTTLNKLPSITSLLSTNEIFQQQQQLTEQSPISHQNGFMMNPPQNYYNFQEQSYAYSASPSIPATRASDQYIPAKYPTPENNNTTSTFAAPPAPNPIPPTTTGTANPMSMGPSTSQQPTYQQVSASCYPPLPPLSQNTQYYYPYQHAAAVSQFPPTPPMGYSPNSIIPHVQSIPSNPYQNAPLPPSSSSTGYFDPTKFGVPPMSAPQSAAVAAAAATNAPNVPSMLNNMTSVNPLMSHSLQGSPGVPQDLGINSMSNRIIKAKRKRASPEQTSRLNEVFAETFFPTSNQRMDLAMELGMTPRTVQIWFQNKRQGWRTEHRRPVPREPVQLNTDYLTEQHDTNKHQQQKLPKRMGSRESVMPLSESGLDSIDPTQLKQNMMPHPQPMPHYQNTYAPS